MPSSVHASLKIDNVAYAFGARQVLKAVRFEVLPGRITLLLGPNGAGKTTLFSLIVGLLAPQEGHINLPGNGRSGVAMVFQQPALDLDLTVKQNLNYHAGLYGLSPAESQEMTRPLLDRLGLSERVQDKVRNLNGGHRRRVEIVRALMTNPSLLLLDEPTAGLDSPTRKALVDFLHEEAKRRGIAVLWATHLTDEASREDDIVVLHEGSVKVSGSVAGVLQQLNTSSLDEAFVELTRKAAA